MPAVPHHTRSWPGTRPAPAIEIGIWLLIAACIIGPRWWVAAQFPSYIWTRDSGSYLTPAIHWLQTGEWITSARRGPVYSLFLAGIFKAGGTLTAVANIQAAIGALTALATVGFARLWLGRRAFWPLAVCSLVYAFHGLPVELERLIRNETLLTLFATLAFGAWFCALRAGSARWSIVSGVFGGFMHLLKGILPIFPIIVLASFAWCWRQNPRRAATLGGCYLALFLLPLAASKVYDRASGTRQPSEPEDGQMFYGRTAQWTRLEGGILPDIKARIYDQAKDYADRYRKTGKLNNNDIVKRTVVPTIKQVIINERHGTLVEVNRICWRLGLEAAAHHPGAYARQVVHDFCVLNFISAQRFRIFEAEQIQSAFADAAAFYRLRPVEEKVLLAGVLELDTSGAAVKSAVQPRGALDGYSRLMRKIGHVRLVSPVFLTTCLLPVLACRRRGRERVFWLGCLTLWFFYLGLLSTVGRPLDRYLMPVVPIMFWSISAAAASAWAYGLGRFQSPEASPSGT